MSYIPPPAGDFDPDSESALSEPVGTGAGDFAGTGPEAFLFDQAQEPTRSGQGNTARDVEAAGQEVSADLAELAALAKERDDYLDALRRLQADFDNYRKRIERQQREYLDRAAGSLVEKLLPVLDTLDLAIAHGGGEDIRQMSSSLFDVLSREGLERINTPGEPFDPNCHDAVAHEPADVVGAAQEVAEVMRAGYRWRGQVLRAAMVKVRG